MRNLIVQHYNSFTRSAYQLAMDFHAMRAWLEDARSCTLEEQDSVDALKHQGLTQASGEDELSISLVMNALTVAKALEGGGRFRHHHGAQSQV